MEERLAILIIDDEPPLLKLMQAFLERLAYSVTTRPDATSALQLFENEPEAFRIVIADLTLPDMPGDAMALRMLELSQDLRVLLCSGYPVDLHSMPPWARKRVGSLQKPFLPNMLAKAVEDLLNRSA